MDGTSTTDRQARNTKKIYTATLHQNLPKSRWKDVVENDVRKKGTVNAGEVVEHMDGWMEQSKWEGTYPSLLMQPLKNKIPFAKKSLSCCRNHFNLASLSDLKGSLEWLNTWQVHGPQSTNMF